VCQITLVGEKEPGQDFPVYQKKREYISDEEGEIYQTVVDVTEAYVNRPDRPLTEDWTEVILLGRHAGHDTVWDRHEPLVSDRCVTGENWLIRLINTRFWRLAVSARRSNITNKRWEDDPRFAHGLEDVLVKHSERFEDVAAEHPEYGPVTIRYGKLKG